MKAPTKTFGSNILQHFRPATLIAALALVALPLQAAVLPVVSKPYGKTYGQWSALWWQWAMSQPLAGHPFVNDSAFNVAAGQSGQVWFLASPLDTVQRQITVPAGKALFVGLLNAEGSDLEGLGTTEAERRESANFLANHIVNPTCSIDGVPVANLQAFRVTTAQFSFTAPTPWIFGDTGGNGLSVADGYFIMLTPLSVGTHTLKIGGGFHFAIADGDPFDFDASADVTYQITVQ